MKLLKKLMVIFVAVLMVMSLTSKIYADGTGTDVTPTGGTSSTPGTPSITIESDATADDKVKTESTVYTYWKILDASIDTDPTVAPASGETTEHGKVTYYVTTEAAKTAIEGTKLFNVTQVGTDSKWYVELKDKNTTAQQIIDELNKLTDEQLTAAFGASGSMSMSGSKAESGTVAPGYYFIKSTLGSKIAVQTLSPVTIKEKNEYVKDNKTIPEVDKNSEIGQEIVYTLTVNVPVTANAQIVLTDTMSKGLTFKQVKSQSPIEGTISDVSDAANDATKFTITYTAEQIKNLVKGKTAAQTITVEVVAIVNKEAAIDTAIPNTLDLKYGHNFESQPVTVNTQTTKFEFDKVDGTDKTTKLTGAEFQFKKGGTVIKLIEVAKGQTYRIATPDEIEAADNKLVDTIVTNGNIVTINGLDLDVTYSLVETKAPTGYNKLDDPIEVKATTPTSSGSESSSEGEATADTTKVFVKQNIENNKGAELPSTGGIGTTIFHIAGAALVLGAGILLISKKRMNNN
jgi:fimbrial isopeptide formation D2 family protein/LPXTG-motif cell wall-anchored protein